MQNSFNRAHRGSLAKFWSGTAPIAIETGRYNVMIIIDRKCIFIIYKVMKYRKILMKYNVYFIFSLVKI